MPVPIIRLLKCSWPTRTRADLYTVGGGGLGLGGGSGLGGGELWIVLVMGCCTSVLVEVTTAVPTLWPCPVPLT